MLDAIGEILPEEAKRLKVSEANLD